MSAIHFYTRAGLWLKIIMRENYGEDYEMTFVLKRCVDYYGYEYFLSFTRIVDFLSSILSIKRFSALTLNLSRKSDGLYTTYSVYFLYINIIQEQKRDEI